MRRIMALLFIASFLLTACGAPAATPTATSQAGSTQTAAVAPSDTPTATSSPTRAPSATPSATPTPTATPANFGPDNFHQFIQVQTYRVSIETAVGKSIFDMRLDAIAYSPDGRYVAVGGCTGNWNGNCISDVYGGHSFLYILDARTARIVTTLPETQVTVSSLAFSTDGEKLVYAVNPDRIVIWGVAAGKIEKVLWQGSNAYRRVAINPDGSQIAEVDSNNLRVWDVASGKMLTQKPGGNHGDYLPRFSADGSRLAAFSLDSGKEIAIYDTATWEKVSVISIPGDYPGALAISQDFKLLATAESVGDVNVLLWDVATGTQVGSLKDPSWSGIDAVGFTPDGQLLLVSGTPSDAAEYDRPFSVWDVSARQELGGMTGPDTSFGKILFSGDGTAFMAGGTLWSLPDEAVLAVRQTLIDFTTALTQGDYGTAAGLYRPYEGDVSYFKSLGVGATDVPALLEFVCSQDSQPCMPVREIVYAGKDDVYDYGLLVRFTAPDGSVYVDADGFDTIWMYADINADGNFIFSTLPPFPRAP